MIVDPEKTRMGLKHIVLRFDSIAHNIELIATRFLTLYPSISLPLPYTSQKPLTPSSFDMPTEIFYSFQAFQKLL